MKLHFRQSVSFYALKSVLAILWMAQASLASPISSVVLKGDENKTPNELKDVSVSEHLGSTLDLEHLTFTNSADGKSHPLKEFFHKGKPTVVNLVYFECPMLCTMVLNGVNDGLKGLDWSVGKEFNVITISINPKDDVETAQKKREAYLEYYEKDSKRDHALTANGWQFFTGSEDQIKKTAEALGFGFKYDSQIQQYAHPAVTFVLTPEGKISRYLYGIQYRPRDLRLALLEASQGKIGTIFDRLLMFCYHFDPSSRGYTLRAVKVMQAGGAGTVFLLGGYLTVFWTRHRKNGKKDSNKERKA